MSKSSRTALIVIIAIVLFGGLIFTLMRQYPSDGTGTATTTPSGTPTPSPSAVATTTGTATSTGTTTNPGGTPVTFEARINQSITVRGISILPLEILEDSRCPEGAQCVWAGTVRVRATVGESSGQSTVIFILNTPIVTGSTTFELSNVMPVARQGVIIAPSEYRLTFSAR